MEIVSAFNHMLINAKAPDEMEGKYLPIFIYLSIYLFYLVYYNLNSATVGSVHVKAKE